MLLMPNMHIVLGAIGDVVLHDDMITGRQQLLIALDLIGDSYRLAAGLNAHSHVVNLTAQRAALFSRGARVGRLSNLLLDTTSHARKYRLPYVASALATV